MDIEHLSEIAEQGELGVSAPWVERERLYVHANISMALEQSVNFFCCVFRQMEMKGKAWGELVKDLA